jgi:hypothetical protein
MKSIDKVTVKNLNYCLRLCSIEIHEVILDRIIDLVELIEIKGDKVSLKDIAKLQKEWIKGNLQFPTFEEYQQYHLINDCKDKAEN